MTGQSGAFWWLCQRGQRSVAFSRRMESVGLVFYITCGATVGRYLLVGFARDRALEEPTAI